MCVNIASNSSSSGTLKNSAESDTSGGSSRARVKSMDMTCPVCNDSYFSLIGVFPLLVLRLYVDVFLTVKYRAGMIESVLMSSIPRESRDSRSAHFHRINEDAMCINPSSSLFTRVNVLRPPPESGPLLAPSQGVVHRSFLVISIGACCAYAYAIARNKF